MPDGAADADTAAPPHQAHATVGWKPILLLAGFLVVAPAFVLGPLAGLLVLSRPRTVREWLWIVLAGGSTLVWLGQHGGLEGQVVRAAAVLLTGAYVALTLWRPAPGWLRATEAAAIAGVSLFVLIVVIGVPWPEVQQTVAYELSTIGRAVPAEHRAQAALFAGRLAAFFPAILIALGIAGVQLAWTWHCRLAERPVGERFCTGEFNL